MAYPSTIDSFPDPAPADPRNAPSLAGGQTLQNTALEAIETYVGTSGSAVPGTVTKVAADAATAAAAAATTANAASVRSLQAHYGYGLDSGCGTTQSRVGGAATLTVATQTLYLNYFVAPSSFTANTVRYGLSVNAGATPTISQWVIYSVTSTTGALVAQLGSSTNDTAMLTSGASNTVLKTKALSAGVPLVAGTWYALGLLVVTGASAPQLHAVSAASTTWQGAWSALLPRESGLVTGQAALPASVVAGSVAISPVRYLADLTL